MQKEFIIENIEALNEVSDYIISLLSKNRFFIFNGNLGVGKTTLIKNIMKSLGSTDSVSSPTFSIVNEYVDKLGKYYCHFDFYRINNSMEAIEIGLFDYFDSNKVCFIEWAEKIEDLLPESFIKIDILVENNHRKISISLI